MHKRNKQAVAVLTAVTLLATPTMGLAAGTSVVVDGENQQYDVMPYAKNDRTLVPLRGIFESLGAEVGWDDKTGTITATRGDKSVVLTVGKRNAIVNGKSMQLETAPEVSQGRTMVPVRLISEALGADVKWDSVNNAVRITSAELRDKMLNLHVSEEVPTIDPAQAFAELTSMTVLQQTNEGLVRYDRNGGQVTPGVAKSWEVSADGRTYTFHLREDAKWSDGSAVTAQDFSYSWERASDSETQAVYQFLFDGVADFSARDERTFVVHLEEPLAHFLTLLARPVFLPVKQSFVEKYAGSFGRDANKMIYNGPFKLTAWAHNDSLLLEKNEYYWDRDQVKLDRVSYLVESSVKDSAVLYEDGIIDRLQVHRDRYADLRGRSDLGDVPHLSLDYLLFNNEHPVLKNEKIRKALTYGLQAQALEEFAYDNNPLAAGVVPVGLADGQGRDYRTVGGDLLGRKQHEAEAKALLAEGMKELGLSEFPTLTLLGGDSQGSFEESVWIVSQLAETLDVGIILETVSFAKRVQRQMSGEYDISSAVWRADYEDPHSFLNLFVTDAIDNDARYSNAEYDKLMRAASKELDIEKRMDILHQAEQLLMSDMPVAPMLYYGTSYLQKPYVKGIINRPLGPNYDLKYVNIEGKK